MSQKEANYPKPYASKSEINKINDVHEKTRARAHATYGTMDPDGRPS